MSHATIAPFLRPGHPREYKTETTVGNEYYYRGPTATLQANKPEISDTWADTRPVASVDFFELNSASGISDLRVVTNITFTPFLFGSTLDEVFYQLRWRPILLPLEVHPAFRSGASSLNADARKHIIGWRAELDPELRSLYKYKRLDSNGTPAATATEIGEGGALTFIKMIEKGVEEYVDYMPIWTKRSIYRGSSAPSSGSCGQKGSPSGSGYPGGYEWVKSADNVERVGTSSRWRRDEEWEGCQKVWADKTNIYP